MWSGWCQAVTCDTIRLFAPLHQASLKRLGTDYIDLCWLHIWDQITPVEEVMRAFDDLVRAGKVLYVGISDAPAWLVAKSNPSGRSSRLEESLAFLRHRSRWPGCASVPSR